MPSKKINRIMIAGTNSGCGKTTITCSLLKAYLKKGYKVTSFKCGPDYIDPMFHSEIIGTKSSNIDLFLCGEKASKYLFAKNSTESDLSIVEGVMGFYDGMGGNTYENSSYDISQRLNIPVVLVIGCKGSSLSVVAMLKGFLDFYKNNIKAVILNNISKAMFPMYKEMIEKHLNLKVLGFMPNEPNAALESRHLGLITAGEIGNLEEKLELLAHNAMEHIDLEALIEIAKEAEPFEYDEIEVSEISKVKIAVSKDKAFCFYYEDSLNLLTSLGAELIPFSPLHDQELPPDIDGLILGGGYPELYLEQLSDNVTMRESIKKAYETGLPIYGECGGYMYLGETIMNYPMVGAIPMGSEMTDKLQNFGYITLTAKKSTLLLGEIEELRAHEFHYSISNNKDHSLIARKTSGRSWEAGYCKENIFALYPHTHFWGNIDFAKRLIRICEDYKNGYYH